MNRNPLDLHRIAEWILVVATGLLPLLFIPSVSVPFQTTKTVFLFGAVLLSAILFFFIRLRDGEIRLPRHPLFLSVWLLPVVYLLSAIFAGNINSYTGLSFDVDTLSFFLLGAILVALGTLLFQKTESILRLYFALLVSFGVLALYQGVRLFLGPDFLSFGIFTDPLANLIGKWHDVAIFFGLTAILSVVSFEALSLNRSAKILLSVVFAISLFFLSIINFFPVWVLIGLFAFAFFVYHLMRGRLKLGEDTRATRSPAVLLLAFALFLCATVFIVWGAALGNTLTGIFNTAQVEARPSWQSTLSVGEGVYAKKFLLGSGPNTFSEMWNLYRPADINATPFWGTDFSSGIGFVPTSFVTTGLVGGVAWILFLLAFLYAGYRGLLISRAGNRFSAYLTLSSYLGALYLWVLCIVYNPSQVLVAFAFLFTGVFLASLSEREGELNEWRFVFSEKPRVGFALVLVLSAFLLLSVGGLFLVGKKYVASLYYQHSVVIANTTGNLDDAETFLNKALLLDRNDAYLRGSIDENLIRLSRIIANTSLPPDDARTQFQNVLTKAITNANEAVSQINPNTYQNWMSLGKVYESVVPLKIQGAYENAITAYQHAETLNPQSPLIPLVLARLSYVHGDTTVAKEYITESLQKKNDYTDAVYLLSQIEIVEGDIRGAISSTEAALVLSPQNPALFFQLGVLRYNTNDFRGAQDVLERAVALNDFYANARYFLGLTYAKMGRTADAIVQFERIEALNPDNGDVKTILQNLRSGKEPLSTAQASALKKTTKPPLSE